MRALIILLLAALPALAQQHEVALLLGVSKPAGRTVQTAVGGKAQLDSGMSFSANYGLRLTGGNTAALYFETVFAATPNHAVNSASGAVTRDIATLYLMPGFRVKFAPQSRVSPYVAAGAGYALFEQSTTRIDGQPNDAPRHIGRAGFNFGAGVDVKLWRFVSFRGEARDFVSGNPAFNAPVEGSVQHNLLIAGGLGLRF